SGYPATGKMHCAKKQSNFEQPKGYPARLLGQQVLKNRHNARIVNSLKTFESGRRCSFSHITRGKRCSFTVSSNAF
ncbi:hypothetical protein AB4043_08390, partial [Terriglobus sp. YAF25]|uniref:hypothetical protein n=1 Tax=Terriglobus sp. YAF25 TaxID=3233080 RepID=UPI003F943465